jgi:hypothetical protein
MAPGAYQDHALVLALHPDSSVAKGVFSMGTGLGVPALNCEAV